MVVNRSWLGFSRASPSASLRAKIFPGEMMPGCSGISLLDQRARVGSNKRDQEW